MFIQHGVKKIANYEQLEKDLNLQKDEENIIRSRGRLKNAPTEYDAKYIEPNKNKILDYKAKELLQTNY